MTDLEEPYALTATEALRRVEAGSLSAMELVVSCQERICEREPDIQAWANINRRVVEETEARSRKSQNPSIPVGVKDIIDVCGLPTMMGTDFHNPTPVTREGGSIAIMRAAGCAFEG